MKKSTRYQEFVNYFSGHQPAPETELHYSNPYELLVAVILSAQCTDKRINMVTPALFRDFPDPKSLANADVETIFSYIKSVSFPNNKAKSLQGMAKLLSTKYNSVVPDSVEELQKLPGVGRKTANVIASVVYNQPAMAVDTHVFRVSKRLGLVDEKLKTPEAVEQELVKNIPKKYIAHAHHWLILHGRYVCIARKPKCIECKIAYFCRFYEKNVMSQMQQQQ
ncbi:MAG: endonuclease III [Cytophagales bacterium]|nr:endonuclease III [Cytophagales bacterium]